MVASEAGYLTLKAFQDLKVCLCRRVTVRYGFHLILEILTLLPIQLDHSERPLIDFLINLESRHFSCFWDLFPCSSFFRLSFRFLKVWGKGGEKTGLSFERKENFQIRMERTRKCLISGWVDPWIFKFSGLGYDN